MAESKLFDEMGQARRKERALFFRELDQILDELESWLHGKSEYLSPNDISLLHQYISTSLLTTMLEQTIRSKFRVRVQAEEMKNVQVE